MTKKTTTAEPNVQAVNNEATAAAEPKQVETAIVAPEQTQQLATGDLIKYTQSQVDLIKNTVAKNATDDELKLFLYQAKKMGLDVLSKQIHFVKRSTRNGPVATFQTSIDGFRIIANRSGDYAGQDAPEYLYGKERKLSKYNKLIPFKAVVKVYKFGPNGVRYLAAVGEAFWAEYCPLPPNDHMWQNMPHIMLAKCAEAQALRKAFPNDLSGIYTSDEMQQAGETEPPAPVLATDVQRKRIFALGAELGRDGDAVKLLVKTHYKLNSFNDLTKTQAAAVINMLNKKVDEKRAAEQVSAVEAENEFDDGAIDVEPGDEIDSDAIADEVDQALG